MTLVEYAKEKAVVEIDPKLVLEFRININCGGMDERRLIELMDSYRDALNVTAEKVKNTLSPVFLIMRKYLPGAYSILFKRKLHFVVFLGRESKYQVGALGYTDNVDTRRMFIAPPTLDYLRQWIVGEFTHTTFHEILHNLKREWIGEDKVWSEGFPEYMCVILYHLTYMFGREMPTIKHKKYKRYSEHIAKYSPYKEYMNYILHWDNQVEPFWGMELFLRGPRALTYLFSEAEKHGLMRGTVAEIKLQTVEVQGEIKIKRSYSKRFSVPLHSDELTWSSPALVRKVGQPILGDLNARIVKIQQELKEQKMISEKIDEYIESFMEFYGQFQSKITYGRNRLKEEVPPTETWLSDFQTTYSEMNTIVEEIERFLDFFIIYKIYKDTGSFDSISHSMQTKYKKQLLDNISYLRDHYEVALRNLREGMPVAVDRRVPKKDVLSYRDIIKFGDEGNVNNYEPFIWVLDEIKRIEASNISIRTQKIKVFNVEYPLLKGLITLFAYSLGKAMYMRSVFDRELRKDANYSWENGSIPRGLESAIDVLYDDDTSGEADIDKALNAVQQRIGVVNPTDRQNSGLFSIRVYTDIITLLSEAKNVLSKRLKQKDWVGYELKHIQRAKGVGVPDIIRGFGKKLMTLYNIIPPTQKQLRTVKARETFSGEINITSSLDALLGESPTLDNVRMDIIEPAIKDIHVAEVFDLSLSMRSTIEVEGLNLSRLSIGIIMGGAIASSIFEDARTLTLDVFSEDATVYEIASNEEYMQIISNLIEKSKNFEKGYSDDEDSWVNQALRLLLQDDFREVTGAGTRLDIALEKLVNSQFMTKAGTKIVIVITDGSPTQGSGISLEGMHQDVEIQKKCISLIKKYGDELKFFFVYLYPREQFYSEEGRPPELLTTKDWQHVLKLSGVSYAESNLVEGSRVDMEMGEETITLLFTRVYQELERTLNELTAF